MLIKVRVYPEEKEDAIIKKAPDAFEVWVKEKPVQGQANAGVIRVLADYFKIPQGKIRLIRGARESHKIFEIK